MVPLSCLMITSLEYASTREDCVSSFLMISSTNPRNVSGRAWMTKSENDQRIWLRNCERCWCDLQEISPPAVVIDLKNIYYSVKIKQNWIEEKLHVLDLNFTSCDLFGQEQWWSPNPSHTVFFTSASWWLHYLQLLHVKEKGNLIFPIWLKKGLIS